MKKILLILLLLIAVPASALTLYEFFGGKLPTIAERTPVFRAYFPDEQYRGSVEQNTRFVQKLTTEPLLGAAFTTISSTDQLTAFPAIYNVNLGNSANTTTPNSWSGLQQFNGNASSSLFSCYGTCYFGATATSSFSTAGALTLITPLTVANGGTGSTTLSSNQVLLGNGTGNITTVSGWGTTNQVLTSGTGTNAPTWSTITTDQTANFNWTGNHGFASSTNSVNPISVNGNVAVSGTTTMANVVLASTTPIHTNGTNLQFPANLGTVGSVLSYTRNATTGAGSMNGNATTTMGTVTLPANTLRSGSQLMMDMFGTAGSGSGCVFGIEFGGGQSTSSLGYVDGTLAHNLIATPHVGAISAKMNVTSATQQYVQSWSGNTSSQGTFGYATTSTFSVTSPLYIAFTGRDPNGNTTCSLAGSSVTIYGN